MKKFILTTLLFAISIADVVLWISLTYKGEINFANVFFTFIGVILILAYFAIVDIKKMKIREF